MAGGQLEQTLRDVIRIELAEAALSGGWGLAARTAELAARLLSRPQDPRGMADSVEFMANEIVENAVKFRVPHAGPVVITAWQDGTTLHFDVQNRAPATSATALARLRDALAESDPGTLLIDRIEANALSNRNEGSGLGVLTLMNDYGATIDWEIGAPDQSGTSPVTTRVSLPIE